MTTHKPFRTFTPSRLRKLRKSLKRQGLSMWRDGQKCQKCGSVKNLTIHHKIHKSCGGVDEKWNYEILCRRCHDLEHSKGAKG